MFSQEIHKLIPLKGPTIVDRKLIELLKEKKSPFKYGIAKNLAK